MTPADMKARTKAYALRVIRLVDCLDGRTTSRVIGQQLVRSATAIGANYRAACRARSKPEFAAKMGIVEEEADESIYWLELLSEGDTVKRDLLSDLMREGNEIVSMVVASINTARGRRKDAANIPDAPPNLQSAIRNPQSAIE